MDAHEGMPALRLNVCHAVSVASFCASSWAVVPGIALLKWDQQRILFPAGQPVWLQVLQYWHLFLVDLAHSRPGQRYTEFQLRNKQTVQVIIAKTFIGFKYALANAIRDEIWLPRHTSP